MGVSLRQRIVDTLEQRGGEVITMRGYAGFVSLAQHMGYGMKGARDQHALDDVVAECRRMEADGVIVVDWAPTSREDMPRASSIKLVAAETDAPEIDLSYLEGLTEDQLRDLVGRLESQNTYLNDRHDEDKAAIASLERDVEEGRQVQSRLRQSVADQGERITELEAQTAELRSQLRVAEVKPSAPMNIVVTSDSSREVEDLQSQLRAARGRVRSLRRDREADQALIEALRADIADLMIIKSCHDALHRELQLTSGEHLAVFKASLGSRAERRQAKRAARRG